MEYTRVFDSVLFVLYITVLSYSLLVKGYISIQFYDVFNVWTYGVMPTQIFDLLIASHSIHTAYMLDIWIFKRMLIRIKNPYEHRH